MLPGSSTHGSTTQSNGAPKLGSSSTLKPPSQLLNGSRVSLAVRAYESFNNRVQSLGGRAPRKAWADESVSDDDGGFLSIPRAGTVPRTTRAPSQDRALVSTPSSSGGGTVVDLSNPPAKLTYMDDSASDRGSTPCLLYTSDAADE